MPRYIGSQYRELLSESGCTLHKVLSTSEVILREGPDRYSLWVENDNFAGAVIEIGGKGFEFCRSTTSEGKDI